MKGEGIYCLEGSWDKAKLYGITYPRGKFFVFDIATRQTKVVGETWRQVVLPDPE